ncbi:hypothetical protein MNBD_GAMMA08-1836 [hydrothermal vent metagenome]|uniref:Uncharacterized protein n=1 Tax=hydrothermal vent metagenome TaxID=652676 RepID=A0A3B0XH31_9ZZZZ
MKDEKSYAYSISVGSKFVLNQEIQIEPQLGRTFMQYGKIKNERDIDIYYPHCSITVNSIKEQAQIIAPTTFEVIKIVDDEEYAQGRLLFASTDLKLVSDGPLITGLVSYYYLKSTDEPNVRALECIQWDSLYENNYLSISEVRQALGDVFTLQLDN